MDPGFYPQYFIPNIMSNNGKSHGKANGNEMEWGGGVHRGYLWLARNEGMDHYSSPYITP